MAIFGKPYWWIWETDDWLHPAVTRTDPRPASRANGSGFTGVNPAETADVITNTCSRCSHRQKTFVRKVKDIFIKIVTDVLAGSDAVTYSIALERRYNERDGVSIHRRLDCLLKRLFKRRSKKTSKLRVTGLCEGNSPVSVNSPHKGPVTQKTFPFDDVIMGVWDVFNERYRGRGIPAVWGLMAP